jgi:hypothetical protein
MKKTSMKLTFRSDIPLPPKWAWIVARWLPESVRMSANLLLVASSAAFAEEGLDATLRDILADVRGARETVEWEKKPNLTFKRESLPHNNISHCNAAGCDGTQCDSDNNHTKGDF